MLAEAFPYRVSVMWGFNPMSATCESDSTNPAFEPAKDGLVESGKARVAIRPPPRVSVIVPTLNEAANLPYVFASLPEGIFEVVVVDGFSTDDTIQVARRLRPDVRVVHQRRPGKGNALACGFAKARGDVIVMLDADGSANPGEIPVFVAALIDGADFAKGSRFTEGGGSNDITFARRAGNWALSRLVNLLFGSRYSDLCYGFNAFWRHCLPALSVDCDGFEVETLINIRVKQAGFRVAEVPSFERGRIHGESKLSTLRDGRRVLRTIVRERIRAGRGPEVEDAVTKVVDHSGSELNTA